MKIFAFHLLNDFSGSPKVLSQVLKGLVKNEEDVHLVCSMSSKGFLDNIEGVKYEDNAYSFHQNVFLRLLKLMYSQLIICFKLYNKVKKEDVIYVNTVLPFGAAVLGKLKGCRVVYHLHETSMKPRVLKAFLFFFVKYAADEVVYVSNFLSKAEKMKVKSSVVYNALEKGFLSKAENTTRFRSNRKDVLMICSLKAYKGVNEFLELANSCSAYNFHLVLNASDSEIELFFKDTNISSNLTLYPRQSDVTPFYEKADLVLNLSRPDEWVETFGLTALEGMAYGVPCIVPEVGGIAEIVDEGVNGYHISSYNLRDIQVRIEELLTNENKMVELGLNCKLHVAKFSESRQVQKLSDIIYNKAS